MTILKILVVLCNQTTESQLTSSQTNNDRFKKFYFTGILYAILIQTITQIMT